MEYKQLKRSKVLKRPPSRSICKLNISPGSKEEEELRELYDSLPRFGPFYTDTGESSELIGKDEAWNHVLRSTKTNVSEQTITSRYMAAIRILEKKARQIYADKAVDPLFTDEFTWMMIKDGCFVLQLALFVLGGSKQLGHPPDDLIFGEKRNKKQIGRWIKSLFFVGNQIPLVVLYQLMKQSFFQNVIRQGKWKRPQDLQKQVLFEFLVLPTLDSSQQKLKTSVTEAFYGLLGIDTKDRFQQPTDLLHALHMLIIGSGSPSDDDHEDNTYEDDEDIEEGDDFGDSTTIRGGATELRQAGIHFRTNNGMGTSGIRFKKNMFCAVVTLPSILVDEDTEFLFRNLKNYEITHRMSKHRREVGAYLQFLSELIRTPDDAKLLASQGIIRGNPKHREKLPRILNKLASKDINQNLRLVRLQINDYSRPPWEKLRNFLSLVLLLTLVQTIYTVLGYYRRP